MVDFFYVEYVIYFASEVIVNVLLGWYVRNIQRKLKTGKKVTTVLEREKKLLLPVFFEFFGLRPFLLDLLTYSGVLFLIIS